MREVEQMQSVYRIPKNIPVVNRKPLLYFAQLCVQFAELQCDLTYAHKPVRCVSEVCVQVRQLDTRRIIKGFQTRVVKDAVALRLQV